MEPAAAFADLVAARRMTRSFDPSPLDRSLLAELCTIALRAPSAGFAQGTDLVIVDEPEAVGTFWRVTVPPEVRPDFPWPGLLAAPVVVLPTADRRRYLARYSEPDKAAGGRGRRSRLGLGLGLGESAEAWPVPYWLVDCAFVVQNLLLGATAHSLGALFFALFEAEAPVRAAFGIPAEVDVLGAVALGRPASDRPSSSTSRGWRAPTEVLHWGAWQGNG